jgi:murein DD-endopeptidase MepM/ murein hydrolase activator NlpD
MKPKALLTFLRFLMYIKQFLWWTGRRLFFVLSKIFGPLFRTAMFLVYKLSYFLKKIGINDGWALLFKREFLQFVLFIAAFLIAVPQTSFASKNHNLLIGQKTIAYALSNPDEDYSFEEVVAADAVPLAAPAENRLGGAVGSSNFGAVVYGGVPNQDLSSIVAGGTAFSKPILLPGAVVGTTRTQPIEYIVEAGDSLGGIAYQFGVSVATIMWENKLGLRSVLQPGDKLVIPPITGVIHTIKKGDNLKKIATLYGAKIEDIVTFNRLKEDGTDLIIGEKIMVPGGVKPEARSLATTVRTTQNNVVVARPPASRQAPSASGYIWPAGSRLITQYYGLRHRALDIAGGPIGTPIYASRAGRVVVSQCGWNGGYGCYVVVDHGNGVKTLYAHNSRLLVSVGDEVDQGQTISLMGNTGNVRGRTGIHLHYEVQVNGVRVNPLGYVR